MPVEEETRTSKYSSYREEIKEKYQNSISFPNLEQKKHKKKSGNPELRKYRRIRTFKTIVYVVLSVLVVGSLIGLLVWVGVSRT